jgi:hypothetical protein
VKFTYDFVGNRREPHLLQMCTHLLHRHLHPSSFLSSLRKFKQSARKGEKKNGSAITDPPTLSL